MNNNAKNNVQHKCLIHPPPLSSVSTNNFLHQIPPTSVQPRANGVANLNSFHSVPFGQFPYMHPNVIRDADATQEVRRPTTHKLVDPSVVPKRERNVMPNLQPNHVAQIPPSKHSFASNDVTIDRLVEKYAANTPPRKICCLARRIRRIYRQHNPLSPAPSIDSITQKLKLKFNSRVTVEIPFSIEVVIKSVEIKSVESVVTKPKNNA